MDESILNKEFIIKSNKGLNRIRKFIGDDEELQAGLRLAINMEIEYRENLSKLPKIDFNK